MSYHVISFYYFNLACASGWTSFGYTGYCYRHFSSPKPWAEAKRYCELIAPHGKTGNLASVGDHFTNTFLSAKKQSVDRRLPRWRQVGVERRVTMEIQSLGFRFVFSEIPMHERTYWIWLILGQPKDGNQKNVAFNFHMPGRWSNEDTYSEREFLCQYKGRRRRQEHYTTLPSIVTYS